MSEAQLAAVRDRLLALPSEEVDAPDLPMATALQEANDLLTLLREQPVWEKLSAVGVDETQRDELDQAIGAARAAQSRWAVTRDRQKSDAQRERETSGLALRANLLAACRFNLRSDRVAQGTLSAIAQGEGIADLIQDLNDLALLIEQKPDAFARDATFDAAKQVEEARSLASTLAAGTSNERLATDQAQAVDLRNRAYTHLDDLVSSLREAGRYACRADEGLRKRFSSAYLSRRRRRSTAQVQAVSAPPVE